LFGAVGGCFVPAEQIEGQTRYLARLIGAGGDRGK